MRPTVRLDGFTVGIPFSDEVDPGIACYWLPIAVLSGTVIAVLLTTSAVIIPLGPKCNRFCLNRSGDVSSFSRSSLCTRSGAVKVVPPETLRNVSASRASSVCGTLPYLTAGLRYRSLTILSCIAAARRDSLANRRIATVPTARAR